MYSYKLNNLNALMVIADPLCETCKLTPRFDGPLEGKTKLNFYKHFLYWFCPFFQSQVAKIVIYLIGIDGDPKSVLQLTRPKYIHAAQVHQISNSKIKSYYLC